MGSHLYSLHHHSSKLSRNSKVLFENVISFHRTKATIIGLLEAKRANEWVVTEKLGDALKNKSNAKRAPKKFRFNLETGKLTLTFTLTQNLSFID
ncbi:glucomannan 4-beta-mannosyltransferase 2-like [Olea europaea subsp. europaea]|uniref:Glucomannan 4-beta-mannosyltransferase 2-like n=1 Tax=Olea europaea subsp. europaea TaxID=158383 RepID=A0A8S0SX72_OLEEU|nr:glucomannan 4-beta-mannosyltransferase 2-like [Olea europaea subsp. europaea]